jgi:hypothetical protein
MSTDITTSATATGGYQRPVGQRRSTYSYL